MNINTPNTSTLHPQRVTTHHSIQHTAAGTADAAKHHVRHYSDDALVSMFMVALLCCALAVTWGLVAGALIRYIFRRNTNKNGEC